MNYQISYQVTPTLLISLFFLLISCSSENEQGTDEKAFQELLKPIPIFTEKMLENLESYSAEIINGQRQALETVLSADKQLKLGLEKSDFPDYHLTWVRAKQIRLQYIVLLIGTAADNSAVTNEGHKYYLATYTPEGKPIAHILFASFQASSLEQDRSYFQWEGDELMVQITSEDTHLMEPVYITKVSNENNFYTLSPEGKIAIKDARISVKYYKGDTEITDEDEINGVEVGVGDLLYKHDGKDIVEYVIYKVVENEYFYQSTTQSPMRLIKKQEKSNGNIVVYSLEGYDTEYKFKEGEAIIIARPKLGQDVTWEVPKYLTRINPDGSESPFRLKRDE